FVNPQPAKGASVFVRIASELDARRPDIPLLVVEGRTSAGGLADAGLDLSGLKNLSRMPNTADPRAFYRVTRVVDAVAVAGVARARGGRGPVQRHPGPGERPRGAARDAGGRRALLHDPGAMHADVGGRADGPRGGAVGGGRRAPLGRRGVRRVAPA